MEVNPTYWGKKPDWDKMVLLHAPEESTRIAMLKRGEADIAAVNWDNAVALRREGFELRQTKASTVPALFMPGYWMQPGPTSDLRVREAMDIAINRQELVDSFFKGFAQPGAGNFAITDLHYGFNPIWYSVKYEPERAKQLLSAAGYPGHSETRRSSCSPAPRSAGSRTSFKSSPATGKPSASRPRSCPWTSLPCAPSGWRRTRP